MIKIFAGLVYLICLTVFIMTYLYLEKINQCACFEKKNVDIPFMKFFQILEIISLTVFFGALYISKMIKKKGIHPFFLVVFMVAFLVIHGYMSYNVFNVYNNIKEECKCTNGWPRYLLYTEGVLSLVGTVRITLTLLFLLLFFIAINFAK